MFFSSHVQFFGALGVKETRESFRVRRRLFSASRIFSLRLYFWDKGNFCYSSFDLVEFMDAFHIGRV